jgi:hypothetical protein
MNGNNSRRQHKNQHSVEKILTRCRLIVRPMWEHEICSKFTHKVEANAQRNCKNCIHSF